MDFLKLALSILTRTACYAWRDYVPLRLSIRATLALLAVLSWHPLEKSALSWARRPLIVKA